MALMHKLGKGCPKCGNFIEKTTGCHIMMCGCEAHGSVADALRSGGCAFVFDWNSMKGIDDGHGYTDMDGEWKRGKGPLTARQLKDPPMCATPGCPFLFHAESADNGGKHCCSKCRDGAGSHGPTCHGLLPRGQ